jgi:UDP-N-acetylglucosamine 2-epimerase (non-hydrolysing)
MHGTNVLAGADPETIIRAFSHILQGVEQPVSPPPLWDGNAAKRIVQVLTQAGTAAWPQP